ncbi:MAG: helix-turn-helix domain-containing protein [Pseudomonadota bacterium]
MRNTVSPHVDRAQFEVLKRQHEATGGWQQRKSEITQLQLLEATVTCIVRKGFAHVRTKDIADEAGLSRGAIMHHFANKAQLFEKTLVYVHSRRLAEFEKAIKALGTEENRTEEGLETYLAQLKSQYFVAAQELLMAARSDEALARILKPQRERFGEEWNALSLKLFPEWAETGEVFHLAMCIVRYMMEGMVMADWFDGPGKDNQQLIDYVRARLSAVRTAAANPESDAAVSTYLHH